MERPDTERDRLWPRRRQFAGCDGAGGTASPTTATRVFISPARCSSPWTSNVLVNNGLEQLYMIRADFNTIRNNYTQGRDPGARDAVLAATTTSRTTCGPRRRSTCWKTTTTTTLFFYDRFEGRVFVGNRSLGNRFELSEFINPTGICLGDRYAERDVCLQELLPLLLLGREPGDLCPRHPRPLRGHSRQGVEGRDDQVSRLHGGLRSRRHGGPERAGRGPGGDELGDQGPQLEPRGRPRSRRQRGRQ